MTRYAASIDNKFIVTRTTTHQIRLFWRMFDLSDDFAKENWELLQRPENKKAFARWKTHWTKGSKILMNDKLWV